MKTLKDLKKEAVENQRRPLGWYRKNGLTALGWSVLSWMMAYGSALNAANYHEATTLFFAISMVMALTGCITLVIGGLCLFTWFTLRNDPEFK